MHSRRLLLLFALLLPIVAATFFFLPKGKSSYSWKENYLEKSKEPYGLSALHRLMQHYFKGEPLKLMQNGIREELPSRPETPSNYILIGEKVRWDTFEINTLLRFVRNGNQAMVIARHLPPDFFTRLYPHTCQGKALRHFSAIRDTSASLNLAHPSLKMNGDFRMPFFSPHPSNQPRPVYEWQFIGREYFCAGKYSLTPLGTINGELVNFARIRYGKGWVYLHTNPIAFTNFALLQPYGRDYVERILSHLPPGPVFWDIISKNPARQMAQEPPEAPKSHLSDKGPLDYILSQPSLAIAWYLLLLTGLLFLLFRTKRRQPPIPVLPANRNLSLEFVQAIGRMNFSQRYHKKIARQQMKYFLQYLRDRFMIDTREPETEMAASLSKKIQVDEEKIRSLLQFYQNIERGSIVTDNSLMEFHQRLQEIYQLSKHYSSNTYGKR